MSCLCVELKMMLLNFEEQLNVKQEILAGIQAEEWYNLGGDEICDDSYWLIGRESDHGGTLIFKYDTISPKRDNSRRTHIGVFRNFQEREVKTLYTFQDVEDIVQCTVNKTCTQMVMCLSEKVIYKSRGLSRDECRVFLVDLVGILPILDSNKYEVEIHDPIAPKQAQFLTLNNDERKQRFMVFEENSIISLYEIWCDSFGWSQSHIIEMIKPVRTLGPAVWYQWDIERQFLYVVPITSDLNLTLQVYQHSDSLLIDLTFEMSFEMSLPQKHFSSTWLCLDRRPVGRNMVLLTSPSGLMCLCHQFISTQIEESVTCTVIYEIDMLLQSQTTVVKVPDVPEMAKQRPIYFSLYGSYILAYLPGIFAHLINVNELMEPGPLNLVWKQKVQHIEADQSGTLSMIPSDTLCGQLGACFYDSQSMKIYQARINEETLVEMFKFNPVTDALSPSLKLSVLHYVLMTGPDPPILKKLLRSMVNDAPDREYGQILKEYIIGSSFAIASRRHGSLFSRMIPFTSSEFQTTYSINFDSGGGSDASSIQFVNQTFHLDIKEIRPGFRSANEFLKLNLVKRHIHRYEIENITKEEIENFNRTKPKMKQILSFFKKQASGDGGITPYIATPYIATAKSNPILSRRRNEILVNDEISTNKPFIKQLGVMIHERCYKTLLDNSGDMRHYNGFDSKGQNKAYLEKFINYSQILVEQCVTLLLLLVQACDIFISEWSSMYYITRTTEDRIGLDTVLEIFERYECIVTEFGLAIPTELEQLVRELTPESLGQLHPEKNIAPPSAALPSLQQAGRFSPSPPPPPPPPGREAQPAGPPSPPPSPPPFGENPPPLPFRGASPLPPPVGTTAPLSSAEAGEAGREILQDTTRSSGDLRFLNFAEQLALKPAALTEERRCLSLTVDPDQIQQFRKGKLEHMADISEKESQDPKMSTLYENIQPFDGVETLQAHGGIEAPKAYGGGEALKEQNRTRPPIPAPRNPRSTSPPGPRGTARDSGTDCSTSDNSDGEPWLSDYTSLIMRSTTRRIRAKREHKRVYPMSYPVRGRALILNMECFDDAVNEGQECLDDREGSDVDCKHITKLFTDLGFQVRKHEDLSSQKALDAIREETQHPDHEKYGMFVLVILSHGSQDVFYGSDGRPIYHHDAFKILSPAKFPAMTGKPKWIIMQCCAGDGVDKIQEIVKDNLTVPVRRKINRHYSSFSDLVIFKACFPGLTSARHPQYGSCFIKMLVELFYKHACHSDILTLARELVGRVLKETGEVEQADIGSQTVTTTTTLQKELYIFPLYNP